MPQQVVFVTDGSSGVHCTQGTAQEPDIPRATVASADIRQFNNLSDYGSAQGMTVRPACDRSSIV